MPLPARKERLVVVSNRLPFILAKGEDGEWRITPGAGGLVTALLPVLRDRGGVWIGWPGAHANVEEVRHAFTSSEAGYTLVPVVLTPEEVHKFYQGFSNEIIWPLFHDLQSHCNFDPSYWRVYQEVNRKFARAVLDESQPGDFIWVHDYQLINVAAELRGRGVSSRIGFFLHTPFPSLDIYLKLPWRFQLLRALLEYDVIGFQTLRDRRNFIQCVRALVKDAGIHGKGQVMLARMNGREVRLGVFPISIDYDAYAREAGSPAIAEKGAQLRQLLPNRQLILGVDRLDYTKAIPDRLEAFGAALARYPELHQRVTLIQVVVPSREDIPRYHELRTRIEQIVGRINGRFTQPGGWVPIHYVFQNLSRKELIAYYRAAQIALVTPLKDGMNLVAKEYCACSTDEDSVLILSEFAGAAAQLQHWALLVNPYDIEGTAEAIVAAFRMPLDERRWRMRRMRRSIRTYDVFWWVDAFLRAAIEKDLSAFPLMEDYLPRANHEVGLR
ncbi:alpha,alpha-trehalose-phosphate synthase [Sulfurifustis variabilis]|uniref:Alpha,alpha-trehalose-phosphate synthase n=1 Tax=Sulfurifustis variabilis TaxID=1675686 RepID=A0A1B4V5U6_9GAMM|nr:trehalose-6-phosphate synthase [Sulfurifustis variabilis]BAU48920.1 alpha,alpha-trehalose-phosphate synthase [Sulfurifustis variabilis]